MALRMLSPEAMCRQNGKLIEALMIAILLAGASARANEAPIALARPKSLSAQLESAPLDSAAFRPAHRPDPDSEKETAFRDELKSGVSSVYGCALKRRSAGAGRVRVAFTVLPSGGLSGLRVAAGFPREEPEVVRCIFDALSRLRIETAPGGARRFGFTFAFAGATKVSF